MRVFVSGVLTLSPEWKARVGSKITVVRGFVGEMAEAWGATQPARQAAALAYYGMFSLAPMLYIALRVAGIFIDELAAADEMYARLVRTLGVETAEFLRQMVVAASERTAGGTILTSLISLGALLYAATGLFAQLKYSLNNIWQVPPETQGGIVHYIKTRLLAFVLVLGVAMIMVVVAFISIVLSVLTTFFDFGGEAVLGNVASFVIVLTLSFAVLYRILPDADVPWRVVWPGAFVAAVMVAIGRWGLSIYLHFSNVTTAFQAAGTLAIILIAIYYGAQIFLGGALLTRVYHTRRRIKSSGTDEV